LDVHIEAIGFTCSVSAGFTEEQQTKSSSKNVKSGKVFLELIRED
jgi:hypothetical protein